jgi:translation elongation factor EF-G
VRVIPGEPEQEPVMAVRVTARAEYAAALVGELRRRGARILEECYRGRVFVLRAEAPLALLLGLPASVRAITDGTSDPAIRLVRYAPIVGDSGPGAA